MELLFGVGVRLLMVECKLMLVHLQILLSMLFGLLMLTEISIWLFVLQVWLLEVLFDVVVKVVVNQNKVVELYQVMV
jgi:hypothetical protein